MEIIKIFLNKIIRRIFIIYCLIKKEDTLKDKILRRKEIEEKKKENIAKRFQKRKQTVK